MNPEYFVNSTHGLCRLIDNGFAVVQGLGIDTIQYYRTEPIQVITFYGTPYYYDYEETDTTDE